MNPKIPRCQSSGYTLIEVLMVVIIIAILASIMSPHFDMLLQKAYQSNTRSNLGSIRSAIALYYSDQLGTYPLASVPDGDPETYGVNLSQALCPHYIQTIPTPILRDRLLTGGGFRFDDMADTASRSNPKRDVFILRGTPGFVPIDRPFIYDPAQGFIYLNDDNYDFSGGKIFYEW